MCRLHSHCVMSQHLTRVSLRSALPVVSAASQHASHCSRALCSCIAPAHVNRHSGGCRVPAGEQREILISEYSSHDSRTRPAYEYNDYNRPVDERSNYGELLTSHSSSASVECFCEFCCYCLESPLPDKRRREKRGGGGFGFGLDCLGLRGRQTMSDRQNGGVLIP